MAGQLPNIQQAASRFTKHAGQAVTQQVKQEVAAVANQGAEQLGADQFLPETELAEPEEELRQGQMPAAEHAQYSEQAKQRDDQALAVLHSRIEQFRGQRQQDTQQYHQNVQEQMQAVNHQQQAVQEIMPQHAARPSAKKSAELQKKKG